VNVGVGAVDAVVLVDVAVVTPSSSSPEQAAAASTSSTAPQRRVRMFSLDR
jgi:hypothetical protein